MYAAPQPDATADFFSALNDPSRWAIKPGVPVFKAHKRVNPATGQTISVDLPKLYRIAANMQQLERRGGVPVRGTLGHTDPKKPETEQPPVAVWYRNARVAPFGPGGEPAVVCDEWLDPQYLPDRKNYPYRSAEYYDDTEQITGVALLARDPYLDLGVVSYTRESVGPTRYARDGTAVGYQHLMGDHMYPPNGLPGAPPAPPQTQQHATPQGPNGTPLTAAPQPAPAPYPPQPAHYAAPNAWLPPGYAPPHPAWTAPAPPAQQQPQPVPYGYPQPHGAQPGQPPRPYGDMGHTPHQIGHDHSGGGWNGGVGYEGEPHPEPDGDEGGLHMLHHHLGQAMEHLSQYLNRARPPAAYAPEPPPPPGAQNTPFPPAGPPAPMPPQGTADAPYGRPHYGYARPPAAPTQPEPARTISGLPIGYQMVVDRLQAQVSEQDRAMKVLLYERNANDTAACASEIGRLAALGFQVGEYEVAELKSKPPEHRGAYIQHVMAKYQRIGTDVLPVGLGDPTSAMVQPENRPATEEEMHAALKMASQGADYTQALNYARGGPAPSGVAGGGVPYIPGMQVNGAGLVFGPNGPQQVPFGNPYPEPEPANGFYGG